MLTLWLNYYAKLNVERQIDFNLSGRSNVVISRAYLNRLARHLRFESILKYVALPRLDVQLQATDEKKTDKDEDKEK